jgi:hypothetical protein
MRVRGVAVRRSVPCVVLALLTALPLLASHKRLTDAEMDGFKGAVKSISTKVEIASPMPRQPDGPAIIYPVSCEICEYDQDGNVVTRGQNWETGFVGETTRYIRDDDGTVRQQVMENEKGELDRRIMMGPFGKTEEEFYQHGSLHGRNTYRYDQDGNLIDWLTSNAEGVQTASTTAAFDENGTVTEQFDRGPNNTFLLHFTQTFDPETDVQIFTNFNEDGTARLTFTARENKITNYWQLPSDKREFGSWVCFRTGCESRNPDDTVFRTVATYADERRRNPTRIELRDAAEQVQMADDYEYEFDQRRNWTKRSVWVWTRESGELKLHEIDSRALAYWK